MPRAVTAAWRHRWALLAVLAFVAAALTVPVRASVALNDDWLFTRSVQILVEEHRLYVFPVSSPNEVFQVAWGAVFASLFGMSFGAVRLSSVVLFLLSGVAFYSLLLSLHVRPTRAALGMLAYLFNPLAFVLAFTFMSDTQFCSLLVIATALYARGVEGGQLRGRWLLAGSTAAAFAFLVRQQGALIPLAIAVWLLLRGRLSVNRQGFLRLAQVGGLPLFAACSFFVWTRLAHTGASTEIFGPSVVRAGVTGAVKLSVALGFVEVMYVALFALPLVVPAVPRLLAAVRALDRRRFAVFAGWVLVFAAGLWLFTRQGRRMPYAGIWLTQTGLGTAHDTRGWQRPLPPVGPVALTLLTAVCAVTAVALAVSAAARLHLHNRRLAAGGAVLAIGLGQALGPLPPSFHFNFDLRVLTLDRYLLPLVPFAICLAISALRSARAGTVAAWVSVALVGLVSVMSTRDYLVYNEALWAMARQANREGVANTRLDAGAGWDAHHLSDGRYAGRPSPRTPNPPWWIDLYAPLTDSSYVVAPSPVPGYVEVTRSEYSAWLQPQPVFVYLLRRADVAGPP